MKGYLFVACLTTAAWIAVGGLVALICGVAVLEVIAVELAAIALVLIGGLVLVDDALGPRS